ncbi:YjzD family protein [Virgibacillus sp. 179-BFC.A HS]|uniref:YjzD family protein n=1 Tax=Tigheibacillus jepli TaxID=3035914 RepID=A0ABU5CK37_9BACI|nr:YjzD family protein [Virgibacillus sp. 179-BFC.A HS]MDY0406184.1 YjzD family protein [Virgibacillus sp. 179-BFC.A HS]
MRYIWTIIWSVLFSATISYVLSSMAGEPFNLTATLVMAAIFCIAVWVLGEGLLKEDKQH